MSASIINVRPGPTVLRVAVHLGLFFVGLELLKACRASTWSGLSAGDVFGLMVAGLLYGTLAALGVGLFGGGLRWTTRQGMSWKVAGPLAGGITGLLMWAFLSVHREQWPTGDDALVVVALGGYAVFGAVWGLPGWGMMVALPLAAGLLAIPLAADYGLIHPALRASAQWWPMIWVAFIGLCGLVLWRKPGRWILRLVHVVLAFAGPWLALQYLDRMPAATKAVDAPNLIFVISDALRADMLSPGRSATLPILTPEIDAIGRSGAVFEEAYSLGPWTMPSMSALFGSTYPPSLTPGAAHTAWLGELWRYAVNPAPKPLAVQLRDRGYATGAITSNALLWGMPGLLEGFDLSLQAHPVLLVRAGLFRACPFLWEALHARIPALAPKRPHDCTEVLNRYADGFLRRCQDRPFFLYLHYIDPHAPCDPPERFRTLQGPWPFYYPYDGGEAWGIPRLGSGFNIEEKDRPYVRSLYEGEVRYIDESMGRLMKRLAELGLDKRTYVCFMSDHGEELWDHGRWGHGQSLRQEQVRVPWIITGPGIAPQRIPAPVSAIDCLPTLAGLLNTEPEPQWSGLSWAEHLCEGQAAPLQRPVFVQGTCDTCWPNPQQAMVDEGYKLVRELGTNAAHLYDLRKDPGEQSDLAQQEPARTAAMTQAIDAWQASFPSRFESAAVPSGNSEQREALDGMGYLR